MNKQKIAASTGEIDKRCINGNNGTRRGKDKKQRKIPPKWRLKPEVRAGLKARFEQLLTICGGLLEMAKAFKVCCVRLTNAYRLRGMIPPEVARRVHYHKKMNGFTGYTATFCRPDLEFDNNGKAYSTTCRKRHMMDYKRKKRS
ncbi:putative transcriptional regulator [Vibrio phage Vc1]|uniref:Transcriptional regulator n=1 Tax=Vibrio phage Vc1 TaxID=1480731 RepID=A0A9X9SEE3_9CAUD|nr:putative transcriptional regulator [Vibrio virus 2019VC1]